MTEYQDAEILHCNRHESTMYLGDKIAQGIPNDFRMVKRFQHFPL